ncbi:hypothetical protein WUBG_05962 [Wuchereria bancrofti]|uniref:RanBP2-type domain-containing protein n=1 Tax=Wuchereria bancrofti TaxID=6293 RepID=J9EL00_WUCBA|nr:hypothetical protein WUBG_05962 [Wuchereria bancrofti]
MSTKKRNRSKAEEEGFEPGSWECTVCTFRNRHEAFKCEMCDTRKGTSTRKPRLNQNVVQHHTVVQNFVLFILAVEGVHTYTLIENKDVK